MVGTALILGANGRFGRSAAEAFWNAGWTVKTFDRKTDSLNDAARDVDVIVNGWNPLYPDWEAHVPALTRDVIAAAKQNDATVIIPGNVYVYGADAPDTFRPDTPHLADNPLGRVRIEMEAAYRNADIQTIILRAGDFLDTAASGNWFDKVMAKGLAKGHLTYPGRADIPHSWAYLPDFAVAIERLARARNWLPRFADLSFEGYTLTGQQMAHLLSEGLDRPIAIKPLTWWPLEVLGLVVPLMKHLCEMRYLWDKPHKLDGTALSEFVPNIPRTDPVEALRVSAIAAAPKLNQAQHRSKQCCAGLSEA